MDKGEKKKGIKNLIPFNELAEEQQRELARKGAYAAAEAKREKKEFKQILETMLQLDIERFTTNEEALSKLKEINPEYSQRIDVKSVIGARLLQKAILGDLTAIGFIRDTIGEKPVEKVEQTNIDTTPFEIKIIKKQSAS